jgi:hypothetical protein
MNFNNLYIIQNKNNNFSEFIFLDSQKKKVFYDLSLTENEYKYSRFNNDLIIYVKHNSTFGIFFKKILDYSLNNLDIKDISIDDYNKTFIENNFVINNENYYRIKIKITKNNKIFVQNSKLKYQLTINKNNFLRNEILKKNILKIKIYINKLSFNEKLKMKTYFYSSIIEIKENNNLEIDKNNIIINLYKNYFFLKYNYNSNIYFKNELKIFTTIDKNEFIIKDNSLYILKNKIDSNIKKIKSSFLYHESNNEYSINFNNIIEYKSFNEKEYININFKKNIPKNNDKFIENFKESKYENVYVINKNFYIKKLNNLYSKYKLINFIKKNDVKKLELVINPMIWKNDSDYVFYVKIISCKIFINTESFESYSKSVNYIDVCINNIIINNNKTTLLYKYNKSEESKFLLRTHNIFNKNIEFDYNKNKIKIRIKDYMMISLLNDIYNKIDIVFNGDIKNVIVYLNRKNEHYVYCNIKNFQKINIKLYSHYNSGYSKIINNINDLLNVITFNKSVSFGLLFFIKTYLDNNGNNIYYLNTVIDSIFLPERDSMLNFKIQV